MDADYGLSAYHQPYNSTTSFVWDSPFSGALLGGWQISGINTFYSGEPVTFQYTPGVAFQVSGIAQDFRGANNYRPNVNGDPLAPESERTITNWFNRNNVVAPTDPSQPFGNAARNSVRGPMFWQVDLMAGRRIRMPWPAGSIEFRAEFFNLLNRSNFRAPNGNRSAAAFGTITQTYDPRQIQLGLKVNF